jgi:hypothetical protein
MLTQDRHPGSRTDKHLYQFVLDGYFLVNNEFFFTLVGSCFRSLCCFFGDFLIHCLHDFASAVPHFLALSQFRGFDILAVNLSYRNFEMLLTVMFNSLKGQLAKRGKHSF